VNLNVNVGFDTVSQKYTANVTHAQRSYQQAPRFFNAGSESFRDVLSAEFNLLHLKNKELLSSLLKSEIQSQIGLFAHA